MKRLLLIGLNHTTAPLEVRERLAFAQQQMLFALSELQKTVAAEAVVLSTCNRVELYLSGEDEIAAEAVIDFLSRFHNLPAELFASHLYHSRGRAVIEHLFSVASSLDSMVLGETQILGQVRQAYEAAREAGATGPVLNPLFQRAVAVGREVLSQTPLAEGRVSVASVAVDYARRIFDSFADKTVLCVGTGKMSQLVLDRFIALHAGRLLVCSREQTRADAIASRYGGRGVAFADLDQHLVEADIVITSTGASHPIITRRQFEKLCKLRKYRPIFLIDIAVPRDVEAGVGELQNVYLYNLDDLQEVVMQTKDGRGQSVSAAEAIVARHVEQYQQWHRQRQIGPTIDALYRRYNQIAQSEMQRAMAKMELDAQQQEQIGELLHRVVQKMLHDPVTRLRTPTDGHEGQAAYLHAVEKLFGLESPANAPEPVDDNA